jgi:hypothetical protein
VENANFNEILTLSRLDEALNKVFTLKLRAKGASVIAPP